MWRRYGYRNEFRRQWARALGWPVKEREEPDGGVWQGLELYDWRTYKAK